MRFKEVLFFGVCFFLLTVFASPVSAQELGSEDATEDVMDRSNIKGPLSFKGTVKELSKKLKGAIITLYQSPDGSHDNLTEILRTTTSGNGEFEYKLEINKFYVLSVEKGGYTTKKIDFDTDVTLARPQHTSVSEFEFEVDMVKDLDGLEFSGSVASVFYQIKTNQFDYELDYSKEEMENEERELRERQEQARLAQLAFEKKQALEEAAKLLLDKENATAQELIQAAITLGDGDKDKTVKGFMDVFPEVDTLREKKALVMFDRLQEERKQTNATGGKIDFQAIFNSAKAFENKVVEEAEEKREAQVAVLRKEQEEAKEKQEEAMAIQQKALEVEASEKLAAAIAEEEMRKAKEEKEKYDKVYYAIFDSNGDSETAIQNLVKTYAKNDPFKEEKAKAIYAEYEKSRLTGTTLTKMDFSKLFQAADVAEQEAIKKQIEEDNKKQSSKLDAFMAKVEEQKRQEQERTMDKIEGGLVDAPKDRASQIAVFIDALPKNDSYKEEKAEAMYEQYKQQKEAIKTIEKTLALVPKNKKSQLELFKNALPDGTENREEVAEKMYDSFVASVVFKKNVSPSERQQDEKLIEESLPASLQGKAQLAQAIYKAAADGTVTNRQQQIDAIADNLPSSVSDRQQVAEEVYDTYVAKKQAQGGTGTVALDFSALFGAADAAAAVAQVKEKEQKAIDKQKAQADLEAKRQEIREKKQELAQKAETQVNEVRKAELSKAKDKKERQLAEAIENGAGDRDKTVEGIVKALPQTGDKGLDRERAEAVYDAYLEESAAIERSGNIGKKVDFAALFAAADRAELERLERQFQEKQAKREVELAEYEEKRTERAIEIANAKEKEAEKAKEEAEVAYENTLHKVEATRQERLNEEQQKKEELAKTIAMEKARREAIEEERKAEELAKVEQDRLEREKSEREEAERLAKLEEDRLRKEREAAEKEAAEQLAMLEKQKQQEEEAKRKEEERLAREEQKRKEAEAKAERDAELAAAKVAEEARKAEEKRLDDEQKEKERVAQEAERAEQERLALLEKQKKEQEDAERKRLEEEEKARKAAELAEAKAAEDARKAEEKRLEDERKEAERLALEEQKRKEAEEKAQRDAELAAAKAAEDARKAEEKRLEEERKEAERLALEEQKRKEAEEKARRDAELAAAKAEEEARIAEQKRQEELAKKKAEEAERQRRADYDQLVIAGDNANAKQDFRTATKNYKDALAMYPDEKATAKKLETANAEVQRLDKEEADRLALEENFKKLMLDGESELANNNYDAAMAKFEQASELKPTEQEPKQKIRNIKRTLDQLAAEEKAKKEAERRYLLTLDEGASAFQAGKLDEARGKYQAASEMKPDESLPKEKLKEIAQREEEIALERQRELDRQEEAKRKYQEELALEAERKEKERQARIAALGLVEDAKQQQRLSEEEIEKARIEKYEKLKESLGGMDLDEEEQRQAFLSELAKIYPPGVTEETVQGKNFVVTRHVINVNNVVTIYEKKTWDWGGVFYFKDSDIAITEAIYKLEVNKY